jgi:DNA-binding CsgD family transcriptional regulator
LTPDDPALSRRRRRRAADFYRLAGDPARAQAMLEQLVGEVSGGGERADVLLELAYIRLGNPPAQAAAIEQAWGDVEGDDARSARLLGFRSWVRLLELDNVGALADARAALEKAERVGDPGVITAAIARVGQIEMWAGEVTPGLLERGAELAVREGIPLDHLTNPRFWLARLRVRQGKVEEARAMLALLEDESAAQGDEQARIDVLWYRAIIEWFVGNLQQALELTTEAYEVGEQTRYPNNAGWNGRMKALIETDLGLVERARASAEAGVAEMDAVGNEIFSLLSLAVLGRLEFALGNPQAAGRYLSDVPGRLRASGLNDPTQPVWADAIETLISLGELERARSYLGAYEENSRRFGSAWAGACAARCRGVLCAADGDLAGALAAFDDALLQLADSPFAFELGRTLLCQGMARRQASQKKAAREALEQALAIFEEVGAQLWAEKARAELARIGGRRAGGDDLTETEKRVADLAAAGRSNKEIAAALFMGVSTVEAHLSHVYRKLGIRSRAGLGSRLATPVDEVTKPMDEVAQS